MKKLSLILILVASLQADIFSQGRSSIGVKIATVYVENQKYTITGLSGSYFVLDNLSVGATYERWFNATPSIQKITLKTTYFVPIDENIRPYGGVFYRHVKISDGLDDTNAYGYRAGVSFVNGNIAVSVGIVQERNEARRGVLENTETYGEMIVGLSF